MIASSNGLWDSVQVFSRSASLGHFTVSPESGASLIEVINDFLDELSAQEFNLRIISIPPPLGRLKGGEIISPFMVEVATDAEGFATRVTELRSSLGVAQAAIKVAMANYQATEEANAASLQQGPTG